LPEAVHRYPTYRFDIAFGLASRGDSLLKAALEVKQAQLIIESSPRSSFYPLGVGRHVDHLIVRFLGVLYPKHVVYYADSPTTWPPPLNPASCPRTT